MGPAHDRMIDELRELRLTIEQGSFKKASDRIEARAWRTDQWKALVPDGVLRANEELFDEVHEHLSTNPVSQVRALGALARLEKLWENVRA